MTGPNFFFPSSDATHDRGRPLRGRCRLRQQEELEEVLGGSPDSSFSVASARRLGSRRLRGLRVKPGGEEDGGKCRLLTKPFREVNRQGRIPLREGRLQALGRG